MLPSFIFQQQCFCNWTALCAVGFSLLLLCISGSIVCTPDVPDPSLPLIFGRRSFGGFNKAVEVCLYSLSVYIFHLFRLHVLTRLFICETQQDEYREVSRQQRFAASEEKELRDEVSAEEMTSRMIKYTGLMRGGAKPGNRSQKRQRK